MTNRFSIWFHPALLPFWSGGLMGLMIIGMALSIYAGQQPQQAGWRRYETRVNAVDRVSTATDFAVSRQLVEVMTTCVRDRPAPPDAQNWSADQWAAAYAEREPSCRAQLVDRIRRDQGESGSRAAGRELDRLGFMAPGESDLSQVQVPAALTAVLPSHP